MRKISQLASAAFMKEEKFRSGNTECNGKMLLLHQHPIAVHTPKGIQLSACGWKTATTKERLNSLPGVHIQQKKGEWFLNGNLWDGSPILIDTSRHTL